MPANRPACNRCYVKRNEAFAAHLPWSVAEIRLHFLSFCRHEKRKPWAGCSSMQRIDEEMFRILIRAGSVRRVTVEPAPWNGKTRWCVVIKLGMDEGVIKSAREAVRTWASLDTAVKWLKACGVSVVEVKIG
ncbi:hypothetical protein JKG47_15010 [Acidithiobacillus sp. MC6.1]|nr:hypothetical protein [Acidithiobacillus sp. MC6.1]